MAATSLSPELEYGLELMRARLDQADYHPTLQETLRMETMTHLQLRRLQRLFEWVVFDPPRHLPVGVIPALLRQKLQDGMADAYRGLLDSSPRFNNYTWTRYATMRGVAYGVGLRGSRRAASSILNLQEHRFGGDIRPSKSVSDFIDLMVLGAALGHQTAFLEWLLTQEEIKPYLPTHNYWEWFFKGALLAADPEMVSYVLDRVKKPIPASLLDSYALDRMKKPIPASLLDYLPPEAFKIKSLLASSWENPDHFYLAWFGHRIATHRAGPSELEFLQTNLGRPLSSSERLSTLKVCWHSCNHKAFVLVWNLGQLPPVELAQLRNYCQYQVDIKTQDRTYMMGLLDFMSFQGLDFNMLLYQATVKRNSWLMEILLRAGTVDPNLTLKALGREAHPSDEDVAAAYELHKLALKLKVQVIHPSEYRLYWEQIAGTDY